MANAKTLDVKIGPAKVEFGDVASGNGAVFDITKGGIQFQVSTTTQQSTVDQFGDTPVKSIMKGRTAQVTVPFALYDLEKLAKVMPNSTLVKDATDPDKMKLTVNAQSGFDMLSVAQKLVIKPLDPSATPNEWVTIPIASPRADIEFTYDADNERVANITFEAYPDENGVLFILGDETATES